MKGREKRGKERERRKGSRGIEGKGEGRRE